MRKNINKFSWKIICLLLSLAFVFFWGAIVFLAENLGDVTGLSLPTYSIYQALFVPFWEVVVVLHVPNWGQIIIGIVTVYYLALIYTAYRLCIYKKQYSIRVFGKWVVISWLGLSLVFFILQTLILVS
jgi:hypothetical protein